MQLRFCAAGSSREAAKGCGSNIFAAEGGGRLPQATKKVGIADGNMLLGRAKSCRWQVFVRRRPPKQGELRTDVSKATMWGETRAAKDLIGLVRSCSFVR